jgi:TIR domain
MAEQSPNLPSLDRLRAAFAQVGAVQRLDRSDLYSFYSMGIFQPVEMMLRELCDKVGQMKHERVGMGQMLAELRKTDVIPRRLFPHLEGIVTLRNMAAHAHPQFEMRAADFEVVKQQVLLLFEWYLSECSLGPLLPRADAAKLLVSPAPSQERARRIFICYAKEDHALAEEMYEAFAQRGHSPWMDKRQLLPGQDWEREIRRAILEADFFIACLSPKSVTKRGYVQREVRYALDVLGQIPPGEIYLIPSVAT